MLMEVWSGLKVTCSVSGNQLSKKTAFLAGIFCRLDAVSQPPTGGGSDLLLADGLALDIIFGILSPVN